MKAGHSWGRGGPGSPSGCGPGFHRGHRWDISANTKTKKIFNKMVRTGVIFKSTSNCINYLLQSGKDGKKGKLVS